MKKFLIVCALVAAALPLRGQEPGGVGALGQEVKLPPAPSGPVPRGRAESKAIPSITRPTLAMLRSSGRGEWPITA